MKLMLSDFGSYTVGGRILHVTDGQPEPVRFTSTTVQDVDPKGHFAVDHAYVQYFVPAERRPGPPMVLVHGGGLSGSAWEATPDGRPGWLQLLLARGHEVHVIDNVERGRSGFAPDHWAARPVMRSMEEAWSLFRIGADSQFENRTPYPGQLFPVVAFERFAQSFVPRWYDAHALQAQALAAALTRIGPAVVMCHSQGAEVAFGALRKVPDQIAGMIVIEASELPESTDPLADCPSLFVTGDFLDRSDPWPDRHAGWRGFSDDLIRRGAPHRNLRSGTELAAGHSHFPMADTNSDETLARVMAAWDELTS